MRGYYGNKAWALNPITLQLGPPSLAPPLLRAQQKQVRASTPRRRSCWRNINIASIASSVLGFLGRAGRCPAGGGVGHHWRHLEAVSICCLFKPVAPACQCCVSVVAVSCSSFLCVELSVVSPVDLEACLASLMLPVSWRAALLPPPPLNKAV